MHLEGHSPFINPLVEERQLGSVTCISPQYLNYQLLELLPILRERSYLRTNQDLSSSWYESYVGAAQIATFMASNLGKKKKKERSQLTSFHKKQINDNDIFLTINEYEPNI